MISYLLNADNGDRPIPIHQLATQSVSENEIIGSAGAELYSVADC